MNLRISLTAVMALVALSQANASWQERTALRQPRQRPLEAFKCASNDLTSYTGVVVRYRRRPGRTMLRIRTDWDTTENVTVRHDGTNDPAAFFRYAGRPFEAKDWARIESSAGVLRKATRATAWVCNDGTVLVDWGVAKE